MDGSRIRKGKVADSKLPGYVWTGPKKARSTTKHKQIFWIKRHFLKKIQANKDTKANAFWLTVNQINAIRFFGSKDSIVSTYSRSLRPRPHVSVFI